MEFELNIIRAIQSIANSFLDGLFQFITMFGEEAILIPLYDLKEKLKEKETDKQRAIVLYCSSGARSKQAKIQLEQMGYNNVFHIKGGLNSLN